MIEKNYNGARQPWTIPTLPEREGYVIDYDIESGWPYYITIEAAAERKRRWDEFMGMFQNRIKGEPRKGMFEVFSTPVDSGNDSEDFKKLWNNSKH